MSSGEVFVRIQLQGGGFFCVSGEGSFVRVLIADMWNLNVNTHKAFLPTGSIVAFELSTYVRVKAPLVRVVAMGIDRFVDHPSRGGRLVEGGFVAFVEPAREPGSREVHGPFHERHKCKRSMSLDRGKES